MSSRALIAVFIRFLAFLLLSRSAIAAPVPAVDWSPKPLELTLASGASTSTTVQMSVSKRLRDVKLSASQELGQFITAISPNAFDLLLAGDTQTLTLAVAVPAGTAPGIYAGTLDVRAGKKTREAQLPISLTVVAAPPPNQAVLGPLAGAEIRAHRLDNLVTPVEGPITANTSPTDLALAGTFRLSLSGIPDDAWILVTASGGQDIDADDDGLLDPSPTANLGTLHALARASDWRGGRQRVNVLTEIAWQALAEEVALGPIDDIDGRLRWIANNLLQGDLTGDGDLDYRDLAAFDPSSEAFRKSLAFPFGAFLAENDQGRSLLDEVHEGQEEGVRNWIADFLGDRLQIPPAPEIVDVSCEVQLPNNRQGLLGGELLISSVVSPTAQIFDQGATLMAAKDAAGHTVLLAFALPGEVVQFSPRSTALALVMLSLGGPRDVEGFTALADRVTAQAGFNPLVTAIQNTLAADPFFLDSLMDYGDLVAQVKAVADGVRAASPAQAAAKTRALVLAAEPLLLIAKDNFYCVKVPFAGWKIKCSPWYESQTSQ